MHLCLQLHRGAQFLQFIEGEKSRTLVNEFLAGLESINRTSTDIDSNGFESPLGEVTGHPTIAGSNVERESAFQICCDRLKHAKRTLPDIPNVTVPLCMKREV